MSVNPKVWFYIQGAYVDVSTYVLGIEGRNAIKIIWGTKDQAGKDSPIKCTFKLFDPNGDLNPDNPYSTYYRQFSRKGTKVKVEGSGAVAVIGELNMLRPSSSLPGGLNTTVDVEVVSFSRRDKRIAQVLESPMYRAIVKDLSSVVSYRPFEEESGATSYRTPVPTEPADLGTAGTISWGAYTEHPGSVRMPTFGTGGQLFWKVAPHTATGEYTFVMCGAIPAAGFSVASGTLARLYFSSGGTISFMDIAYTSPAISLVLNFYGPSGLIGSASLLNSPEASSYTLGRTFMLIVALTQNGADVDTEVTIYNDGKEEASGDSISTGFFDTLAGATLGAIGYVDVGQSDIANTSWGHIVLSTSSIFSSDALSAVPRGPYAGYNGEKSTYRIARVCDDAGITITGYVAPNARTGGTDLGPIGTSKTREQIILDAAQADGGILGQTKSSEPVGYFWAPRHVLYASAPKVWLTRAQAHVFRMQAEDDDLALSNSVTADRVGGTKHTDSMDTADGYHFTTEDSASSPDGIGTDNESSGGQLVLSKDSQLRPTAEWMTHVRSWKEQRYSAIVVDLLRTEVASDSALVTALLGLYLSDVISVDMTGANLRWEETERVLAMIYGGVIDLGQMQHDLTFITRPARIFEASQLDTSGSTVVAAATTATTALRFATSLGPPWEADETPYLVQAGGEAMKVTICVDDAIAFVALGTASSGNNATVTPGIPAGMVNGLSTMICHAAVRPGSAGVQATPTGWVLVHDGGNLKTFGKYYVTGDTAPNITISGGAAGDDTYARISGWTGLSLEAAGGTKAVPAHASQSNGAATNVATPALDIVRDSALVFYWGARADDATSVATISGATELIDTALTAGTDMHVMLDYVIEPALEITVAADTFTVTTGGGAAVSRAAVVALRPTQSVTVTRNQNNVNVAIAAGTAVKGWRMGVNGL